MVVELIEDRRKRGFDIGEIHDPAFVDIQIPGHMNNNSERMAVQARAFMLSRQVRQAVGRLKREVFKNFHTAQQIPLNESLIEFLIEFLGIYGFAGSIARGDARDNTPMRGLYCALYRVHPSAARENAGIPGLRSLLGWHQVGGRPALIHDLR